MKISLKIKSLYKQYPDVCAVNNVSFDAREGDIIALLGPNGAGKSTLMNIIAGVLSSDCGEITINKVDIKLSPIDTKQQIGFLAEGAPLYGDMKVGTFLSYMADLKGLSKNQKSDRLNEVKEIANIASVWDCKIETLSKGFQRRVAFAQSILANPPILLLDEPTDGLDPNQKEHLRKSIQTLAEHKIILISTHLLDDVSKMCNRILVMSQGKIIADDKPDMILKNTKSYTLESAFRKLTGGSHV